MNTYSIGYATEARCRAAAQQKPRQNRWDIDAIDRLAEGIGTADDMRACAEILRSVGAFGDAADLESMI